MAQGGLYIRELEIPLDKCEISITSTHGIIEISCSLILLAIDGVGRRLDLQTKHVYPPYLF
uniref:Uncharacterized protein n=1 Tax=Picea sitchensis TaxID=3332 RepID=A0A6B9XS77_PICSI|nr:hypothetical protein Q903MT_gene6850 [Picea sitchensis]